MSDPRDQMQAEHDALLSEHSAFQTPAAVPGEEEIGKLLMKQFYEDWFAPGKIAHGRSVYWDFVNGSSAWTTQARAILDLFAPILAEKEREIRDLLTRAQCAELDRSRATEFRLKAEARALAAETDSEHWQNLFESTRATMQQDINRLEKERDMFRRARNQAEAALAAERERCAKVATSCLVPAAEGEGNDFRLGAHAARSAIAAAIRAQGE